MRLTHLAAAALLAGAALSRAAAQQADTGTLAIHGYLTQAYAISSGVQHYGITGQGSTDFRYAALQVRYDKGQDGFLIQFNERRLGRSPSTQFESDVRLNWGFYEHRFTDGTQLRVGRVPVPRGIYNEQRSIGVVLPFYRAPVIFYDEGAYFSETLDGVVASHTFAADRSWNLETHAYAGGWSLLQYDQETGPDYYIGRVRAENGFGGQLWLDTPIDGVRLGAAAQHYVFHTIDETSNAFADVQQVYDLQASFDATRDRWFVRAEGLEQHYETDHFYSSYLQGGFRLTPKLMVVSQGEYAVERKYSIPPWPETFTWHKSLAIGANYYFAPNLVLKAETHWDRGVQVEQWVADPGQPPFFRYLIASVSASF